MSPLPRASLRPARLIGLMTPLVVAAGVVALLLVPNLLMHTGLRSNASSMPLLDSDATSQSAAAVASPRMIH